MYLSSPDITWRDARGEPISEAIEVALLCLGGLLAVAMAGSMSLLLLALPIALVLHRLSWLRALRLRADRDQKTGLLNASAWTAVAERTVERARVDGGDVAVLMIDLDHFKRINDEHGHLTGDDVLREVATVLLREVRPDSTVGRFGGEEFVVLLPSTNRSAAAAVAERLRRAIEDTSHEGTGTPRVAVTASVGVSRPLDQDGLHGLLASADRAVYEAKAAGRNVVREDAESTDSHERSRRRPGHSPSLSD